MKKFLIPILLFIFPLIGCSQEEVELKEVIKPVKTMQVMKTSRVLKFELPGIVRASKRAELSFDVPGRIIVLNAKEGSIIQEGDLIAKLDDRDYKNNYQSAKANLKEAKLTYHRYRNLVEKNAVSKANMDRAEKAYDIAKADMNVVEKAFEDTKLKAYFSGKISARYVENFQNVQAKQPIVTIEDRSTLEIIIHAPEEGLAKTGREDVLSMSASFSVIPDKKFPLKLKEISEQADPATRTYAVVLTMKAPENYNILSGMTADVEIQVDASTQSNAEEIFIPVTAVMGDKENNSYAWIYSAETGTVSKRKILIGKMTGVDIHIESGLHYGETIITAGVNYLVEGMKVRPLVGKIGE